MTTLTHQTALALAIDRIEDLLQEEDGYAHKEARKALPRLEAALASQPELPEPQIPALFVQPGYERIGSTGRTTGKLYCDAANGYTVALYTTAHLQQAVEQERLRFGVIDALLKEYGLQAVDFVADFKQARSKQELIEKAHYEGWKEGYDEGWASALDFD